MMSKYQYHLCRVLFALLTISLSNSLVCLSAQRDGLGGGGKGTSSSVKVAPDQGRRVKDKVPVKQAATAKSAKVLSESVDTESHTAKVTNTAADTALTAPPTPETQRQASETRYSVQTPVAQSGTGLDPLLTISVALVAVIVSFFGGHQIGKLSQRKNADTERVRNKRIHEAELTALNDELESIRGKHERMTERLRELEEEGPKGSSERLNITIVRANSEEEPRRESERPGSVSKITGYLSTPDANGEFDDSQRSTSYRIGISIFAIEYDGAGAQIAQIKVADRSDAMELLLRRREHLLEPVADMLNAYRSDTVAIVVETPGEIELRGNRWRVRRKMTARYI